MATKTIARRPIPRLRFLVWTQNLSQTLLIPFLAIFTALVIGAILILLAGRNPVPAYEQLFESTLLDPKGLLKSLLNTTPLILVGLAVGFAFKAGLFNIGAQGQLVMGSVGAAWAGVAFADLPPVLHIPLALVVGALAGGIWGAIPGLLKAFTDANEVITTIMLNLVAAQFTQWLVVNATSGSPAGPLNHRGDTSNPAAAGTKEIAESAQLPNVFVLPGQENELHIGLFIAIVVAILSLILMRRTTFGFEIRMVGMNPTAARYAGINSKAVIAWTMAIAGSFAGLAGAIETLGRYDGYETSHSIGLGFDGITVSLLANNNPIGTIFSAFLFGVLDEGSRELNKSPIAVEGRLTTVIQALILMFIAAPQIIQYIYRLKGIKASGKRLGAS